MNKLLFINPNILPFSQKVALLGFSFFFISLTISKTQTDTIPDQIQILIENAIEDGGGGEEDFDYNALIENLEVFRKKPLNLNKARVEDLEELRLLSDVQIAGLIDYRAQFGDLISLQELQSIPSFDLKTIQEILPFTAVSGGVDDYNVPLKNLFFKGKNELFFRYQRFVETQRGYVEGEFEDPYLGDPFRIYTRFRHTYENKFSFGFTAENDPGEEFFKGSNKQGFDFYSGHLFLRDYSKVIKAVALGDYNIGLGQGLIAKAGFGYGKSAAVMDIRRSARALSPQRSANEFDFFRGAAVTVGLGEKIETTVFYSSRKRDGNTLSFNFIDSLGNEIFSTDFGFSSFQNSGFHRYKAEIEDENSVKIQSMGAALKYKLPRGHIGLNTIYHRFDEPLFRNTRAYNQFEFNNEIDLLNVSLDYSYIYRNFHFFGETAWGDNNSIATLNGLLIGMNQRVDFSILHRHYPVDFHSLNARPFGETTATGGRNENGVYLGLELRPANRLKIQAYYDIWEHPWLRSSIDAPSAGTEMFAQVTYTLKRQFEIILRGKTENKALNTRHFDGNNNLIYDQNRASLRLQVANKISKTLELRNRIEVVRFRVESPSGRISTENTSLENENFSDIEIIPYASYGFLFYQDVIFRPAGSPWSFTARYALFDTDDYNSRVYAYENNLINNFSVPAYAYRGSRAYLNLRYRGIRNLSLEGRIAQTYLSGKDGEVIFESFSSGREEIIGRTKTEVKFQLKWDF